MEIETIAQILFNNLPNELRNNRNLQELVQIFINIVRKASENPHVYFEVSESIYKSVKIFRHFSNITSVKNDQIIFVIGSEITVDTTLSVSKNDDCYKVFLNTCKKTNDNFGEIIEIELTIKNGITIWMITRLTTDQNDFYHTYYSEYHLYTEDGKELHSVDKEEEKDKSFSDIFGVPLEDARKYRLNFDKYKEFLNNSRKAKLMNSIDASYTEEQKLFTAPFDINYLADFLLECYMDTESEEDENNEGIDMYYNEEYNESDEEDSKESEIDTKSEEYQKAKNLQNQIIASTGNIGDFTMTFNLFINLTNYLTNGSSNINTPGLIIRKVDSEYTSFYIHISSDRIYIIPRTLPQDELKPMYESHPLNSGIYGLDEFFGINKNYKLEPND